MVQHAETFWSLFAVDMDALLEMQPADTWDSFPLFQMLNNYLRNHGHYLVENSLIFNQTSQLSASISPEYFYPRCRFCFLKTDFLNILLKKIISKK